jgi:transcription-repair coupling factor (superfamily II helicase)
LISITDDARRRLKAIEAFSDLGSGFNIAMQDLDIRGAGNLLGGEQSGFIADMGFETYQRILSEAFSELREERGLEDTTDMSAKDYEYISDCTIDTDLEILIPDSYIGITAEKIRLYKELDAITDEKGLLLFLDAMEDRFGPIPEQVTQLAYTVRLRRLAVELGFEKIVLKNGMLLAYFVNNQMSSYYKSDHFAKILTFLQKQAKRFRIKEQKDKLYITVNAVDSVERAYKIFLEMKS